ncbi:uncharacterized protein LOC135847321 [Planococcus citri]|uniref:uncharacterized protein LOC135838441 n=1 Tax=Planococcus citri TaxID=170843 RepID=UPI0031F789E3
MENNLEEDDEYCASAQVTTEHSRKRRGNPAMWKRNQAKKAKRELRNNGCILKCKHDSESNHCKVRTIDIDLIYNFHKQFQSIESAPERRKFLQRCISLNSVARTRVKDENRVRRSRNYTIECSIQTDTGRIKVCKTVFCSILSIGRATLDLAAETFMLPSDQCVEKRGGSEPKLTALKDAVIEHIKSFKVRERHYGRNDTVGRVYLPCELNIVEMHKMFLEKYPDFKDCKYSFYRDVFRYNFNIGFGSIRKDSCATCEQYKNLLKNSDEINRTEYNYGSRREILLERGLHRIRSKRFFKELNLLPADTITINFDLMANQVLPKTPISDAFYSRQISYHTFGIIIHKKKQPKESVLDKTTMFFYRWLETEYGRGSNEIVSCLIHFLSTTLLPILRAQNIHKLRFFSDSCTGQNKNYSAVTTLMDFCLRNELEFEWFFPVRGHSYMPADRSFGLIEQGMKKLDTIINPEEYDSIIRNKGNLVIVGTDDVPIKDYQTATSKILKTNKGFLISEVKVISYDSKDPYVIRSRSSYSGLPTSSVMFKKPEMKKKTPKNLLTRVPIVEKKNRASAAKIKDVRKLMSKLKIRSPFYEKLFADENILDDGNDEDEENDEAITSRNEDLF